MASEEKKVRLINTSRKSFRTSGGTLGPAGPEGSTVEVPADEAKRLLKYKGVHDASKYSRPAGEVEKLQKQIDALTKENAKLKEDLEKATKKGGQ